MKFSWKIWFNKTIKLPILLKFFKKFIWYLTFFKKYKMWNYLRNIYIFRIYWPSKIPNNNNKFNFLKNIKLINRMRIFVYAFLGNLKMQKNICNICNIQKYKKYPK